MVRSSRIRRRVFRTRRPPSVVVTDAAYEFIPPHYGKIWPRLLNILTPYFLNTRYGVTKVELRGEDTLQSLQRAGHSILLTPNHSRMADPVVLLQMARRLKQSLFIMASSHLFHGSHVMSFTMRRIGAFSVYREGVDQTAVRTAIDILSRGQRPLVMFPEGALSQANDHLNALMDGVGMIARSAQRRIRTTHGHPDRRVIVLPVGIKYLFQGDLLEAVSPILSDIEERLLWGVQQDRPLTDRVTRIGSALLSLKEIEYLGRPQSGSIEDRQVRFIDGVLCPLERVWLTTTSETVIERVRELRRQIIPEMIDGELGPQELQRRWKHLSDLELAQAISLFPPEYVQSRPTVDRILETVERFAENLTGKEQTHRPLHAVVQIGEPIDVEPGRPRNTTGDPLIGNIAGQLQEILKNLATESRLYEA
ncbi:MAG: 1-acyl-sn-glycerol-3-phosphate acyltransferase [Fuerstiella sp.]|nr:1-acyl-sn-glycerol-3-phosphate acyltransferase [Fuerstiella sp.]